MRGTEQLLNKYESIYEALSAKQKLELNIDKNIANSFEFALYMEEVLRTIYKEGKIKRKKL